MLMKSLIFLLPIGGSLMNRLKRTPLYTEYEESAKLINFWGWELPVQFKGVIHEHEVTRTKAGLFDVSHMGQICIRGKRSKDFLQHMVTNDVSKLVQTRVQYALMCNEKGGTIDDFLIYMMKDNEYFLVVNASNVEKDVAWLKKHAENYKDVSITDESENYALLALQGPFAEKILEKLTDESIKPLRFFSFYPNIQLKELQEHVIISRTGYTGEDGFEIYVKKQASRKLWNLLLGAGKEFGLEPAGLGARDTLRFEAGLPLYGQELSEIITPIEAGLSFAVKVNKDSDFIGKQVLENQIERGVNRKIVGIEMIEKGIPRTGYSVFNENKIKIGTVTSGTFSPTLKKNLGLALIDTKEALIGRDVWVQIRKRKVKAKIVKIPFYDVK